MTAGGCTSPPGWRQALICVSIDCHGWKWVHRDDFRIKPSCVHCGRKFDFSKYEWHDKRKGTTPSTIRRQSEAKEAPWSRKGAPAKAAAKAKAKAKATAKPRAQAAAGSAKEEARTDGTTEQNAQPKKVGLQTETGGAAAASNAKPDPLQAGNLVVDTKRAASDPVYSCQVQVELLKAMNVDESDPRRVSAERSLEAAQAAREASRPPAEKIAILRRQIQSLTKRLTETTSRRLEQETSYRKLREELNQSQADIQQLEGALTVAQDELKAQEALLPRPRGILKVGPQKSTIPEVTPSPSELFKQFMDSIRYHWSDIEDFGMDYAAFQYMAAAQGAIELHVQQCEARDKEGDKHKADSADNTMQDVEEELPPAKRRHGWDPTPSGGTDTPILPPGSRETWTEEDFPILDGEVDAKTPAPTSGVIKSLKSDTKKAMAASYKGKGKAKTKSGAKGKPMHIAQADELLDALVGQARRGTPAAGAESGALGSLGAGEAAADVQQTSAIVQQSGVQGAEGGGPMPAGDVISSSASSSSGAHGAAHQAAAAVQATTGAGAQPGATISVTAEAGVRANATADETPGAGAAAGAGAVNAEAVLSEARASEPLVGQTGTGAEIGDQQGAKQPTPSTTPGNMGAQGVGSVEPDGSTGAAGHSMGTGSSNQ